MTPANFLFRCLCGFGACEALAPGGFSAWGLQCLKVTCDSCKFLASGLRCLCGFGACWQGEGVGPVCAVFGRKLVWPVGWMRALVAVWKSHSRFCSNHFRPVSPFTNHRIPDMYIVQVTKLKLKQKQAEGIAEARSGQRGPVGTGRGVQTGIRA